MLVGEGSVSVGGDLPHNWRPLDIAMVGQKGLPATFGGIERHVEEIGARLADRGHRVRIYCRETYGEFGGPGYRGMELRPVPTVDSKHLDAIVASASSTALAMAARCDIVHYHALGPGLLAPFPRYLSRAGVVLTVHGLDHKRGKWGRGAKAVLGTAHWMSGHVPERTVCVSQDLQAHYRREFGRETDYIPNGVNDPSVLPARRIVDEFGLEPGSYAMFVGRLVPEKAPDQLIRAYRQVPGDRRLVIVGDSSFSGEYTAGLKELARQDPRVLFTGFAFGDLLSELFRHAALFVQPSLLEGLPITLLEAASYGLPVVASDIPPHLEVLGRSSAPGRRIFATGDESALAAAITAAFAGGPAETAGAGVLRGEVLAGYNWDRATDQLERLYLDVVRGRRSRQRPASAPAGVPAGQLRSTTAEGHR